VIARLQQFLQRLSPRERLMVLAGGVLAIVLVVLAIILPLQSSVSSAQERVHQKRDDLVWLRSVTPQLAMMGIARPAPKLNESLGALVDRTARESGFGKSLLGSQVSGDGALNVRLDKLPFDALVSWLSQLQERYGVQVDSATVDSANETGTVTATLVLRAG
jgi:general secretion pathway protein M